MKPRIRRPVPGSGDSRSPHQDERLHRILVAPGLDLARHVRRQVNYFSILLLVLLGVGTVLTVSYLVEVHEAIRETALDHLIATAALICITILFFVNRAGHFRFAAALVVMVAVVAILATAIPQASTSEVTMLGYLSIPMVLSGLLLSVPFTIAVVGVSAVGVFALPLLFDVGSADIPLFSTLLIGLFVIVAAAFRRRVEEDRRAELQESEARFEALATHDPLTGLPNRIMFDGEAKKAIARARRDDRMVAVLFVDIDNFREVNDALGHAMGDRLLQEVGGRLSEGLRESDIVCRSSGDEFLVLAESIKSKSGMARVVGKIREAVREPVRLGDRDVYVSVSIGGSVFPTHASTPAELVRMADVALYRAKARGRDTWAFFDDDMRGGASRRIELAGELKTAIERGQISVLYQPQVDSRTGRIFAVECLSRWEHPVHGAISPVDFIPVAEQTGLITEITRHVLETAAREVALTLGLKVSVNASERDLRDEKLSEALRYLRTEYGLRSDLFEIELTENIVFQNMDRSRTILAGLKELGVGLAVDDFGAGYATLRQIADFPLDTLKIDRSFIQRLVGDTGNTAIVAGVVEIARRLGMRLVAEGIEDEHQLRVLSELGCTTIQGWYYSKAIAVDELRRLLVTGFPATGSNGR